MTLFLSLSSAALTVFCLNFFLWVTVTSAAVNVSAQDKKDHTSLHIAALNNTQASVMAILDVGVLPAARESRRDIGGWQNVKRGHMRLLPGRMFRDCPDCPEMIVIPAGSFLMGSPDDEEGRYKDEGPRHLVTIEKPFAIGKHEVTRREFEAFIRETGRDMGGDCWYWDSEESKPKKDGARSWRKPGFEQTDLDPVVCVSWEDAKMYVEWLSDKTGKRYRLPSESEWEYAARGKSRTSRYWGDDASVQCSHANGADETLKTRYSNLRWVVASCRDGFVHTAPVGSLLANGFGLHDVLGNAWEWVADCRKERYVGAPSDGSAWTDGICLGRVLRGGSWSNKPSFLRTAGRFWLPSRLRISINGFRVARTLESLVLTSLHQGTTGETP